MHNGNGFFDSLKHAFSPSNISHTLQDIVNSPITKGIVKTVAPIAIKAGSQALGVAVTDATGNPEIGNTIHQLVIVYIAPHIGISIKIAMIICLFL